MCLHKSWQHAYDMKQFSMLRFSDYEISVIWACRYKSRFKRTPFEYNWKNATTLLDQKHLHRKDARWIPC